MFPIISANNEQISSPINSRPPSAAGGGTSNTYTSQNGISAHAPHCFNKISAECGRGASGLSAREHAGECHMSISSRPPPLKVQATIFKCFLIFTRFWGTFTALVLCGIGIELIFYRHIAGYYFIVGGALLFLLETAWVVGIFLRLCIRNDQHKVFRCWTLVQWFECWKRTLVYGPLAALPIVFPHQLWLSYVAGGQLITLAGLHLLLSFKGPRRRRRRNERLLHGGEVESCESSRFEEVTEVLDDGLPDPMPGSSYSLADSLLLEQQQQDAMMEM